MHRRRGRQWCSPCPTATAQDLVSQGAGAFPRCSVFFSWTTSAARTVMTVWPPTGGLRAGVCTAAARGRDERGRPAAAGTPRGCRAAPPPPPTRAGLTPPGKAAPRSKGSGGGGARGHSGAPPPPTGPRLMRGTGLTLDERGGRSGAAAAAAPRTAGRLTSTSRRYGRGRPEVERERGRTKRGV